MREKDSCVSCNYSHAVNPDLSHRVASSPIHSHCDETFQDEASKSQKQVSLLKQCGQRKDNASIGSLKPAATTTACLGVVSFDKLTKKTTGANTQRHSWHVYEDAFSLEGCVRREVKD